MKTFIKSENRKIAVIILHEIYGINSFIKDLCIYYKMQGFDVFCPDMIQGKHFSYSDAEKAYDYFYSNKGLEYYKEVIDLVTKLKNTYNKVFIIGFSVGATIAWRCVENPYCDGIICCYGSRIRDYLLLEPLIPVLLLFAKNDSFNVEFVAEQLKDIENIEIHILNASHGFMDPYSDSYNKVQKLNAYSTINQFISKII